MGDHNGGRQACTSSPLGENVVCQASMALQTPSRSVPRGFPDPQATARRSALRGSPATPSGWVRSRAERWHEPKPEPTCLVSQVPSQIVGPVDRSIVQHNVNPAFGGIRPVQTVQRRQEEVAVLPPPPRGDQRECHLPTPARHRVVRMCQGFGSDANGRADTNRSRSSASNAQCWSRRLRPHLVLYRAHQPLQCPAVPPIAKRAGPQAWRLLQQPR